MDELQPDQTVVHLVRHGEVDNPHGVLYGRLPNYRLTRLGQQMAERVAEHVASWPITHLATSPLERAQDTIAPIAARFPDVEVTIQPLVIEAASDFEGQVFGRGNKALKNPRNWWKMRNPVRPSWGEPYTEIAERMRLAITTAAAAAGPGGQALVVSHQLPIWMARRSAEGRPLFHDLRKRECDLASITSMHLRQGRIARVTYAAPAQDLVPFKDRGMNFSVGSDPAVR